jgi:hypothetical protein
MKNYKLKNGMWAMCIGAAMAFSFTSCSDDDDSNGGGGAPPPSPPAQDQMSFTLSGDLEGEKTGQAFVFVAGAGGVSNVVLSGNDGPGITEGAQTFSLNFYQSGDQVPEEGTYEIGFEQGSNGTGFWVLYESFEDGPANPVSYGGVSGSSGTLEITSASETMISGTFEFTAVNASGDELIVENGIFNAGID